MRSLSPDEKELWKRVAATIRPLSRERESPPEGGERSSSEQPARTDQGVPRRSLRQAPARPPAPSPRQDPNHSTATLDSSWDRRLRSGSIDPDRVLDLHGLDLDQAWTAIDRGLERAITAGERVVLLITGHARPGDPPVERGKIRAAVHDWLAASRHASKIAAVRGANRRHGGGGSLYIILRRNRAKSTLS